MISSQCDHFQWKPVTQYDEKRGDGERNPHQVAAESKDENRKICVFVLHRRNLLSKVSPLLFSRSTGLMAEYF